MMEDPPHDEPEVDAVTADEVATGMTDEQLSEAWQAVTDEYNLTDLEEAVRVEMKRRGLER